MMLSLVYKLGAKSMGFFTLAIICCSLQIVMLSFAYKLDAKSMGFFITLAIDMLFLTNCDVIISVQIRCQIYGVLHHSSN